MNQKESTQVIQNAMRGNEIVRGSSRILDCFPTEEEEGMKDQYPHEYPMHLEDDRELRPGVICEQEVDEENRKGRIDIEKRWLVNSGVHIYYVKEVSKFRAYKWLQKPIIINTGKRPIWGIARGGVEIGMLIGKVVIGDVLLVPNLDVESDLLAVMTLMRAGFRVNFEAGQVEIYNNRTTWGVASPIRHDGGLCYLEEYDIVEQYALATQCVDIQTLQT